MMSFFGAELPPNLSGCSIDTSRAKSNARVVSMCAQKLGMTEHSEPRTDSLGCDVYWHNVVYDNMKAIIKPGGAGVKVNKFPGMTDLTRKVALTQAIRSMRELYPHEYQFYPASWVLPSQLFEFQDHFRDTAAASAASNRTGDVSAEPCYIVKPDDGAQGTGIYLIGAPDQLRSSTDRQLVQEYVSSPYLLADKLKFDFRVYAVIKSINPLSIYVAREGMVRFCTERYSRPTPDNFTNHYAHLTNYSLNKMNMSRYVHYFFCPMYVHSKSLKEQLQGSKRLLSTVFRQMEAQGVRTRFLWHEIKLIIVKTVVAMIPGLMLAYEHHFCDEPNSPQCFQIMGFDIIVRDDGVPLLLEVNSSPSLSIEHEIMKESSDPTMPPEPLIVRSIVDELVKIPLVRDCLLLVMNRLDKGEDIGRRRSANDKIATGRSSVVGAQTDLTDWDDVQSQLTDRSGRQSGVNKTREDDEEERLNTPVSHLTEIFPGRYGRNSRHLLVLDRAVYLFLQSVNIRHTINISLPSLKVFFRRCGLLQVIGLKELEAQFIDIDYYLSGERFDSTSGLPFHGFLQLLFYVAHLKYPYSDGTLAALLRLLSDCDASLRSIGVKSGRLRRMERKHDESSNKSPEIFLLPMRMRRALGTVGARGRNVAGHERGAADVRSKSIPRQQRAYITRQKSTDNINAWL